MDRWPSDLDQKIDRALFSAPGLIFLNLIALAALCYRAGVLA
jgi:hypothetical protein